MKICDKFMNVKYDTDKSTILSLRRCQIKMKKYACNKTGLSDTCQNWRNFRDAINTFILQIGL